MKVALCCIVKKENTYLKEWLEYHFSIGVDHIIIYDNNEINGETLEWLKYDNRITIINYRGKNRPQLMAYRDCMEKNYSNFDWIGFFDIDEFVFFKTDKKIQTYLGRECFKPFDAISLTWRNYGDSGLLGNEEGKGREVVSRFLKPINRIASSCYSDDIIKKFVRCKKYNSFEITSPHTMFKAIIQNTCNSDGRKNSSSRIRVDFNETLCYLKHYCTKTIVEYLEQKIGRGAVCSENDPYTVSRFFIINENTEEKQEIIKQFFNTNKKE